MTTQETDSDNSIRAGQPDASFLRLPGLFRRWEIEQVLEEGTDFRFEEAGQASDGTRLFAVYRREPEPTPVEE